MKTKYIFTTLFVLFIFLLSSLNLFSASPVPPPKRDVPGKRFTLSLGQLYVPEYFNPELSEKTDIIFFFKGAAWCSEQNFYDAKKNAVLVSVNLKDLWETFRKPDNFRALLNETLSTLKKEGITDKPYGKICLTSFSGGYVAIRELLKESEFTEIVTDIVLADSLYAPKIEGKPDERDMSTVKPFLDFARLAAEGKKTFIFTHLYPPKKEHQGNTTTLTASYLIDKLALTKTFPQDEQSSRKALLLYRANKGNCTILGFSGMTTQDHFEHFYALSDFWKLTSFEDIK